MAGEEAWNGGGARSEAQRQAPPSGPQQPKPLAGRPGKTRGGVAGWAPCRPGCPGSDPRPACWSYPSAWGGSRPSTRFLPGAGPVGHKPSAVKFKEVRETLRRNLSSAGKRNKASLRGALRPARSRPGPGHPRGSRCRPSAQHPPPQGWSKETLSSPCCSPA